jgi:hypothetical protein
MKRFGPEMFEKVARAGAQGLLIALALAACSEDVPPELDPNTFGGAHREQIEHNCDLAIACAREDEPVDEGAFDRCVLATAGGLNTNPASQLSFLITYRRCSALPACDFDLCAGAGSMGFGQQQLAKVQHTCEAKVQCASERGTPFPNVGEVLENCILDTIIGLDPLGGAERQAFQDNYYQCAHLTGCAYTQCFPF